MYKFVFSLYFFFLGCGRNTKDLKKNLYLDVVWEHSPQRAHRGFQNHKKSFAFFIFSSLNGLNQNCFLEINKPKKIIVEQR